MNPTNQPSNAMTNDVLDMLSKMFQRCSFHIQQQHGVNIPMEKWREMAQLAIPDHATPTATPKASRSSPKPLNGGCIFTITRGDRKGQPCGKTAKYAGPTCKAHSNKLAGQVAAPSTMPGMNGFPVPTMPGMNGVPVPTMPGMNGIGQLSTIGGGNVPIPGLANPPLGLPNGLNQFGSETGPLHLPETNGAIQVPPLLPIPAELPTQSTDPVTLPPVPLSQPMFSVEGGESEDGEDVGEE